MCMNSVGGTADSEAKARRLVAGLYDAFNRRDVDGAVALLRDDVVWADGMSGGYVLGRNGVREYWDRQSRTIDVLVIPGDFAVDDGGRIVVVRVRQVVRDLEGAVLGEGAVMHRFEVSSGQVTRFEIVGGSSAGA
jgi:ketosteroid isomerase-like protein